MPIQFFSKKKIHRCREIFYQEKRNPLVCLQGRTEQNGDGCLTEKSSVLSRLQTPSPTSLEKQAQSKREQGPRRRTQATTDSHSRTTSSEVASSCLQEVFSHRTNVERGVELLPVLSLHEQTRKFLWLVDSALVSKDEDSV